MNKRTDRIVLVLLVLNVVMLLVGIFGLAWQVRHEAARPAVPTNLAERVMPGDSARLLAPRP